MNTRILSAAALAALAYTGTAGADSLFNQRASSEGTLIAEKLSRFEVGEIITVLVREKIDASVQADTNTKKETDVATTAAEGQNSFLVSPNSDGGHGILNPEELPNWAGATQNESKNTGKTKRTSELTTQVGCLVTEVLPNGNLMIEGRRKVTVNRDDSTLVVYGMVRSKDVSPDNTIPSTLMADATIQLQGKGTLWNNQRRGLLTRVMDWVNPF
ncbi:MAG: hypothetical protein GC168_11455 [Candidatus Hydrogenedens sp.]|nr:hypothetical protein [Candidatus Hydrogenedens sp.]